MKEHRFTLYGVIFLLFLNLNGCNLLGSEEVAEEVSVEKKGEAVIVMNGTASPIYTAIFERQSLALIDVYICHDPGLCEGLSSGQRQTMRLQDVNDYEPGDEVVVWWWRLREKAGTDEYEVIDFTAVVIDT